MTEPGRSRRHPAHHDLTDSLSATNERLDRIGQGQVPDDPDAVDRFLLQWRVRERALVRRWWVFWVVCAGIGALGVTVGVWMMLGW